MTGPILGGFLLTMTLPNFMNFAVFSIVGIVAAIGLSVIADKYSATNILVQEEKKADSAKASEVAASLE
jgi:MFS transporter, AAHS family, benzoate transport protein